MAESRVHGPSVAKVPCRFFAKGKCSAGDTCPFLHQSVTNSSSDQNSSLPPNDIGKRYCLYFQQGTCKYGTSCMFMHQTSGTNNLSEASDSSESCIISSSKTNTSLSSKLKKSPSSPSSNSQNSASSVSKPSLRNSSNLKGVESGQNNKKTGAKSKRQVSTGCSQASTSISSSDCDSDNSKENISPTEDESFSIANSRLNLDAPEFIPSYMVSAVNLKTEENSDTNVAGGVVKSWAQIVNPNGSSAVSSVVEPVLDPNGLPLLCPYAEMGACPYFESCQYMHGDICEFCGLACLHPYSEELSKQHITECIKQHEIDMEHSMAVARSRDKVCGVCFEVIMEKNPAWEQKFGILPNCNHCFCLACIRKWRQAKQFESKIIRACPECRVTSDFVCPSPYWVDTKEDKDKLLTEYKRALSEKKCRYFQEGGKCPFGNKCFYLHALPDGTKVDLGPPIRRRLKDSNGDIIIVDDHLLWDFVFGREEGGWLDEFDDDILDDLLIDALTIGLD